MVKLCTHIGLVIVGMLLWSLLLNSFIYAEYYWPVAEPESHGCRTYTCST